jgi:hypothetical protein
MPAKKKPAALAKPARARRATKAPIGAKSALGVKLQAIADDGKCRTALHTVVWSDKIVDGRGISEGEGVYWREGQMLTPQPISKRRLRMLKVAAQ